MRSDVVGMVVAALVGGGVALAASLGVVAVMSTTPTSAEQTTLVQYADE